MTAELTPEQIQAAKDFFAEQAKHDGCTWKQVGPCVYCTDHDVRLYQGSVPDEKRTEPKCEPEEHDWDPDMGQGFYYVCRRCGELEWTE